MLGVVNESKNIQERRKKMQKLFLNAQKKQLIKNHSKHKEAWNDEHPQNVDSKVVVKLFNPAGSGTWYLTELNPETNEAFGLSCLQEKELGYINLNELMSFKGPLGIGIERDAWFPMNKKTLEDCKKL